MRQRGTSISEVWEYSVDGSEWETLAVGALAEDIKDADEIVLRLRVKQSAIALYEGSLQFSISLINVTPEP